jgi:hypothetical protein
VLKRYIPPWDDALAWVVAAVVLLAAVFLANVPVPVAVLVGLIAYVGLALARAREPAVPEKQPPMTDDQAFAAAAERTAQLRTLARGIQDRDVRAWLDQFCDKSDAILSVIQEDRKLRAAPLFLQGVVIPAEQLLEDYARLERRNVAAAKPVLARVKSENLPLITKATDDFYQQLHQTDVIEIDTLSERLEYNLSDRLPAIGRGDQ